MTDEQKLADLKAARDLLTKKLPLHKASKCEVCGTNAINWAGWTYIEFRYCHDVAICEKCVDEHPDLVEHCFQLKIQGL